MTVKSASQTPLRDEHARATHEAVVVAAHELFVQDGYAATSIRAIAARARVSEQTVYRLFGTKAGLLQAAVTAADLLPLASITSDPPAAWNAST